MADQIRKIRNQLTQAPALVVFLLAAFFYFYKAGSIPGGHTFDALSDALNAECLRLTGADEYGNPWPVMIRAFDDYRAPGYVYFLALLGGFFRLTPDHVRFTAMTCGFLGLLAVFGVWRRWLAPRGESPFKLFLEASIFGAILLSSWVLLPHRTGVEYCLVLLSISALIAATFSFLEKPDLKKAIVLGVVTGAQLYVYDGTKSFFFAQWGFLAGVFVFRKIIAQKQKASSKSLLGHLIAAAVIALTIAAPILHDLGTEQKTLKRLRTIQTHSLNQVFETYYRQMRIKFVFFEGDKNLRHHTGYKGELNQGLLLFYLFGLFALMMKVLGDRDERWLYISMLYVMSSIPAALTNEAVPNSLRNLATVVPLTFIILLGASSFMGDSHLWQKKPRARQALWILLFLGIVFEATQNLKTYYAIPAEKNAPLWSYWAPITLTEPPPRSDDHSPGSLNERLTRLLSQNDLSYCEGAITHQP